MRRTSWLQIKRISVASIIVLPWLHELGHLLFGWLLGVPVLSVALLPQQIGERYGMYVTFDFVDVSVLSFVLVLLGGFTITMIISSAIYHSNEYVGRLWIWASFVASVFDFADIFGLFGLRIGGYLRLGAYFSVIFVIRMIIKRRYYSSQKFSIFSLDAQKFPNPSLPVMVYSLRFGFVI